MSADYTSKKFKKLVTKLQQESWQLELLISGFVIFGLFSVIEDSEKLAREALIVGKFLKQNILGVVIVSCYILIFNLILHLILRGLWIGALGLRYVSGDIDFEILNYNDKFKNYLKKKIISFDKYIATLENYCSILFAISFLLVFYFISFFIIIFIVASVIKFIIQNENLLELPREIIGYGLLIVFGIGTVLTAIDFFSLGFLKKKKIITKIYFPFYWIFSYITLSFLYRPIIYNFLDNRFGKRISIFLVPIYIGIILLTSVQYRISNYISDDISDKSILMSAENYEDMHLEDDDLIKSTTIQSKVITDNFIKVFIVFNRKTEDQIFSYHPKLKPQNDARGYFSSAISFSDDQETKKRNDRLTKKYLEIFNEIHQTFIDTISYEQDFLISRNDKGQLGFETYLNIKNLSEGKHLFILKRLQKLCDA